MRATNDTTTGRRQRYITVSQYTNKYYRVTTNYSFPAFGGKANHHPARPWNCCLLQGTDLLPCRSWRADAPTEQGLRIWSSISFIPFWCFAIPCRLFVQRCTIARAVTTCRCHMHRFGLEWLTPCRITRFTIYFNSRKLSVFRQKKKLNFLHRHMYFICAKLYRSPSHKQSVFYSGKSLTQARKHEVYNCGADASEMLKTITCSLFHELARAHTLFQRWAAALQTHAFSFFEVKKRTVLTKPTVVSGTSFHSNLAPRTSPDYDKIIYSLCIIRTMYKLSDISPIPHEQTHFVQSTFALHAE